MKIKKFYENLQDIPEVGDYIVINIMSGDNNIKNFINNTIGRIAHIYPDHNTTHQPYQQIGVQYENIPITILVRKRI